MSKIALHVAGISVAAALGVSSANAQVLIHKDLSLAMATTIALTAIENCKAAGYNVSVHGSAATAKPSWDSSPRRRPQHLLKTP